MTRCGSSIFDVNARMTQLKGGGKGDSIDWTKNQSRCAWGVALKTRRPSVVLKAHSELSKGVRQGQRVTIGRAP